MTECIATRRIRVRECDDRLDERRIQESSLSRRRHTRRHRSVVWFALAVYACVLVAVCHAQPGNNNNNNNNPPFPFNTPTVRPSPVPSSAQPIPSSQPPRMTPGPPAPTTQPPRPTQPPPSPSPPPPTPPPPPPTQAPPPPAQTPRPPAPPPPPPPTPSTPAPTTARPAPTPTTPAPTTAAPTPTPAPEPTGTPRPLPTQPRDTPAPITPLPTQPPAPPANAPPATAPPTTPPVPKLTPGTPKATTEAPASKAPSANASDSGSGSGPSSKPTATPKSSTSAAPSRTATPTPSSDNALKEASVKTTPTPTSTKSSRSENAETSAVKGSSSSSPMMIGLIVGGIAMVVLSAGLFIYLRVRDRDDDDDDDDKAEPRRTHRDLQATDRNTPGFTQLSPVRPPPPAYNPLPSQFPPPPTGNGNGNDNRLSHLLGPKPLNDQYSDRSLDSLHSSNQYGDSVDLHDPALDVLTPTSDIAALDSMHNDSFSSDHITGFNSLTASGKPKMYSKQSSDDIYASSVGSYASMTETGLQQYYKTRESGENDIGDDDSDEDDDFDDMPIVELNDTDTMTGNQWAAATTAAPRLQSGMYSDVGDFDDSDPEDDDYGHDEDTSFIGSERSNLSDISSGYNGSSAGGSGGQRYGSDIFSDDGNDFMDNGPSTRGQQTNYNDDSSRTRGSNFSSGDEFNDSDSDDGGRDSSDSYI